jgi:hypothetical protein|tara:strand:- start:134 stop:337 length:204 start_codon:yes stop_codon:yes gene_type:complete
MNPEVLNFTEHFRKQLRQYMNELTDSVALGNAKNFEEYQRFVGQIEGLAIAERELLNLVKTQDQEDD